MNGAQAAWRRIASTNPSPSSPPRPEDELVAPVVLLALEDEGVVVVGVAGQGAGALLDVAFRVVALAEREQLEQLAGEVLVGVRAAVEGVVEVLEHRRVADDAAEQPGEALGVAPE